MRTRGRPVLGTISGLFLGLFVALDLLLFGVVALDSAVLTILPVVGLVLGLALSLWAPIGRRPVAVAATAPAPPVPPATVVPPVATVGAPDASPATDAPSGGDASPVD